MEFKTWYGMKWNVMVKEQEEEEEENKHMNLLAHLGFTSKRLKCKHTREIRI